MKCRSEPQVVESRTLRIASWGLTISGSLTVSVLMSLTPFQQIARIAAPYIRSSSPGRAEGFFSSVGTSPVSNRAFVRYSVLMTRAPATAPCGVAAAASAGCGSRRIVTAVPSPTGEGRRRTSSSADAPEVHRTELAWALLGELGVEFQVV